MKIEQELKLIIKDALKDYIRANSLEMKEIPDPKIDRPKIEEHGHYSSNIAMVAAGVFGANPKELAAGIKSIIDEKEGIVERIDIKGPGFINFFLKRSRYIDLLDDVCQGGDKYGRIDIGKGKKAQVEFVSANPTGPLHVGHGRNAIYGDALANVLSAAGYSVEKEYYLNDAGNQINTLGRSVYLRLKEEEGKKIEFPEECYQGEYITDFAKEIIKSDADYQKFKKLSEADAIKWCGQYAAFRILEGIKDDLAVCGVSFDNYYFESSLHTKGEVEKAVNLLRENGFIYEKDGAIWFKTAEFGDEKDRVLKKSSGEWTYFAADIAYHLDKFERGFDVIVDVWGADHAGHVPRMKYAAQALGYDPDRLKLVLMQLVNLIRGGEMVSMSTRTATYETLRDLINDVGRDVCRYFFLMRSHNAQLDFDLELAKTESPDNPVFYIQYAHARICSIFRKAREEGIVFAPEKINLDLLDLEDEIKLARFLGELPAVIRDAAMSLEPHKMSFYLLELARMFQSYYAKAKSDDRYRVLQGGADRINSKLYLLKNIQIVLKNGLGILGLSAPEAMEKEPSDE